MQSYDAYLADSKSTPLFDTSVSVHKLRLKQQGLRIPASSLERATSILLLRVPRFFVARIQRIQSQCAAGVVSSHVLCAFSLCLRAFFKSSGTSGSGHSREISTERAMVSPAFALAALSMPFSTFNQWPFLPSGSSGALKGESVYCSFNHHRATRWERSRLHSWVV